MATQVDVLDLEQGADGYLHCCMKLLVPPRAADRMVSAIEPDRYQADVRAWMEQGLNRRLGLEIGRGPLAEVDFIQEPEFVREFFGRY